MQTCCLQTPAAGVNKRRSMRVFPAQPAAVATEKQERLTAAASNDNRLVVSHRNPVLQAAHVAHANQMKARQRANAEPRQSREDLFKSS